MTHTHRGTKAVASIAAAFLITVALVTATASPSQAITTSPGKSSLGMWIIVDAADLTVLDGMSLEIYDQGGSVIFASTWGAATANTTVLGGTCHVSFNSPSYHYYYIECADLPPGMYSFGVTKQEVAEFATTACDTFGPYTEPISGAPGVLDIVGGQAVTCSLGYTMYENSVTGSASVKRSYFCLSIWSYGSAWSRDSSAPSMVSL